MEELLNYINNYFFDIGIEGQITFDEKNPMLLLRTQKDYKGYSGQYVMISGTNVNDGIFEITGTIYQNGALFVTFKENNFVGGEFTGVIYFLSVPKTIVNIKKEIEEFKSKNKNTNYTSESFGNYSYSKATNNKGVPLKWQDIFKEDLIPYRKIYNDIEYVEVF